MIPLPLGLISWILMGLATGLSAAKLLPGEPPMGAAASLGVGLTGACVGGLLATLLGFGGLAGFDWRGLLIATLTAILSLLILRIAKLAGST